MKPTFAREPGRPNDEPFAVIPGGEGTPIPEPPAHLGAIGRDQWSRLWTVGRAWLSNDAHYDLMALLCEVSERYEGLRVQAAKAKPMTKGSMGQMRVNPIYDVLRAHEDQIARYLTLAKFVPDPKRQPTKPKQSKLDQLRSSRAAV